jgi:hypothetical protein
MIDRQDNRLIIAAKDEQSGASLVRMLVVGLVLIVFGMVAVVLIV